MFKLFVCLYGHYIQLVFFFLQALNLMMQKWLGGLYVNQPTGTVYPSYCVLVHIYLNVACLFDFFMKQLVYWLRIVEL